MDKITQTVKAKLEEECDEESLKVLPKTIDTVRKQVPLSVQNFVFYALFQIFYVIYSNCWYIMVPLHAFRSSLQS